MMTMTVDDDDDAKSFLYRESTWLDRLLSKVGITCIQEDWFELLFVPTNR